MEREDWKELAGIFLTLLAFLLFHFHLVETEPLICWFFGFLGGACLIAGISAWIDARIEQKLKRAR